MRPNPATISVKIIDIISERKDSCFVPKILKKTGGSSPLHTDAKVIKGFGRAAPKVLNQKPMRSASPPIIAPIQGPNRIPPRYIGTGPKPSLIYGVSIKLANRVSTILIAMRILAWTIIEVEDLMLNTSFSQRLAETATSLRKRRFY